MTQEAMGTLQAKASELAKAPSSVQMADTKQERGSSLLEGCSGRPLPRGPDPAMKSLALPGQLPEPADSKWDQLFIQPN